MRSESKAYTANYYEMNVDANALASAQELIPFLIKTLAPKSLLELGSGVGIWSKVALDCGIADLRAVDGPWVSADRLRVPADKFLSHHLGTPLNLGRSFDLALCLEVGEHLESGAADILVESLTRHAPVIVFGAAMPFQGGTLHVNEQWPNYWRERFEAKGYCMIDVVRPAFWNNSSVAYYYKQNTFVYCKTETMGDLARTLQAAAAECYRSSSNFVFIHPDKYLELATFENINVTRMVRRAPYLLGRALINRIKRLF